MHLKRISLAFASVLMISSSLATSAFAETTIRRNVTASVLAETTAAAESTSADTSNTASNNAGTGEVSSPNEHIPSTVNNFTVLRPFRYRQILFQNLQYKDRLVKLDELKGE